LVKSEGSNADKRVFRRRTAKTRAVQALVATGFRQFVPI